ncbi:hypothetical protein B0H67DRAFT_103559 [Lasiosphaeris hirsuta]|uniref:Uncharacterized protein n=1 Tax=Lasiosphaeris hirsuta TaxID=260670 RepID=A0AA40AYN5_9PEZI|nr:hypothetical protein B0H67DRAFT_103559 [Lasiosphaeris hirsuta]
MSHQLQAHFITAIRSKFYQPQRGKYEETNAADVGGSPCRSYQTTRNLMACPVTSKSRRTVRATPCRIMRGTMIVARARTSPIIPSKQHIINQHLTCQGDNDDGESRHSNTTLSDLLRQCQWGVHISAPNDFLRAGRKPRRRLPVPLRSLLHHGWPACTKIITSDNFANTEPNLDRTVAYPGTACPAGFTPASLHNGHDLDQPLRKTHPVHQNPHANMVLSQSSHF